MEKEKLVHYVPADMVNRLKKLLVRLWETKNPASAYLSAILNDVEPEVRSLNDTILDISSRERDTTIREKEKNWARERENLRDEAERGLEELRAAAEARLEKSKVSFACEKAELSEANSRAQREIEALASENRKMNERVSDQENELKKRLFEAKAEYERESGRRVQKTVEEITGRLLLALNAAEKKNEDAAAEAARANKESARLKEALAERTRQLEEGIARQAEELEVKEHDLVSLRATARELERRIAEENEAHQAELKEKLRAKESELNKAAAERLEMEREEWEAQSGRQEGVLARTAEELKKAQKELSGLTAENRRLGDSLAGQESELERRLFEAKSEFERESLHRVQAAVEEVSGRLLTALNAAEKKKDESLSEVAHAKEECARLKDALAERARQFRESCEWQAAEAAEKDKYLAAAHEKVKELEKKLVALGDEHHAELTERLREKAAEFRSRQDRFEGESEKERAAYLRSIADLKNGFEEEKAAWEAELARIKTKADEKRAELEAGLNTSLDTRAAELERDYAARRAALAGELRGKEAELNREAEERLEFERATWEARSRRQEGLLAVTAEDFRKAQKEIEALASENRIVKDGLAGKSEREKELQAREARLAEELAAKDKRLASSQEKVKELENKAAGLNKEHRAELEDKLRAKEAELRSQLEEDEKAKGEYLKSIAGLKARFEGEKGAWEAERERIKTKADAKFAELETGLKASLDARAAELERDYAARRAALAGELRGKEAELDREAEERLEFERATWEARSRRQESLLARTAEDFKKAQREIDVLTAENRRGNEMLSEMARSGKFKDEAQFNEAVARERERLEAGQAGQRAGLEAKVKELEAVLGAKEKAWAVEKERYESELSLCAVSTRSFISGQTQKMKADLAKWKEALEEEYKERLTEQLRAKDVQLITEKGRLAQEFLEKYAALESRLGDLKAGNPPGVKKERGT